MKKLTDCEWRVIIDCEKTKCWWYAYTYDNCDVDIECLMMEGYTKTKLGTRRNWEEFAKLNGIKHWKWA